MHHASCPASMIWILTPAVLARLLSRCAPFCAPPRDTSARDPLPGFLSGCCTGSVLGCHRIRQHVECVGQRISPCSICGGRYPGDAPQDREAVSRLRLGVRAGRSSTTELCIPLGGLRRRWWPPRVDRGATTTDRARRHSCKQQLYPTLEEAGWRIHRQHRSGSSRSAGRGVAALAPRAQDVPVAPRESD
eukprot:COSAG05_NODE_1523_length_4641_cov_5.853589_1_plen_190_part_00